MSESNNTVYDSYSEYSNISVQQANHNGAIEIISTSDNKNTHTLMNKTLIFSDEKNKMSSQKEPFFHCFSVPLKNKENINVQEKYPKFMVENDVKLYQPVNFDVDDVPGMELEDGRIVTYGNLKFVIDATGSMSPFINGAKDQVFEIAKNHEKNLDEIYEKLFPGKKFKHYIRISIIGYRDHCDSIKLEILPFTTDLNYVKYFLSNLNATGGGDQPEDMLSGFKAMMSQNVGENNKFINNLVCLITDAPAHGSFMIDNHIREDGNYEHEKDQWVSILNKMKEQNHDLMVVKTGKSVDKSIDFMKKIYDEEGKFSIVVKDLTSVHEKASCMEGGLLGCVGYAEMTDAIGTAISGGSTESGLMFYTRSSAATCAKDLKKEYCMKNEEKEVENTLNGIANLMVVSATLNPDEFKTKKSEVNKDDDENDN